MIKARIRKVGGEYRGILISETPAGSNLLNSLGPEPYLDFSDRLAAKTTLTPPEAKTILKEVFGPYGINEFQLDMVQ